MKTSTGSSANLLLLGSSVLLIVMVSSVLRSPLSAVGPVLQQLSDFMQLSPLQGSLLVSIPLIMFAVCSAVVSRFSGRIGLHAYLLGGMSILALGLVLRVSGSASALFIGSGLVGLGICIGNVVTPGYIKRYFSGQIGLMTGLFSVAMNVTAAFASGFSIRIGQWTELGWQGSLGIWALPALGAVVVVIVNAAQLKKQAVPETGDRQHGHSPALFFSRQAWNISVFMGLQSLVYYTIISWLPAVLQERGMGQNEPGWVLFIIQMAMLPITFLGPIWAGKMKQQTGLVLALSLVMLSSILMFAVMDLSWVYLAAILLGLSNGLSFSLSILFFSIRTRSAGAAIQLSGMAQSAGYLIAAFGPPLFGKLRGVSGSWNSSFLFLLLSILLMAYVGAKAARDKKVEDC